MIKAQVNFNKRLREWDGFGFNYVETCQTPDYATNPQDYGGFSTLNEEKRQEIISLIFGEDGLKPGVIKMFFDPFHQKEENQNPKDPAIINMDNYDHTTTTKWIRYFVREGLKRTRERDGDFKIITTLYGPPAWMTKQKFVRGRDLDDPYEIELAKYYISWIKYLREVEYFPVKYVCLHNEGEDFVRWPEDGSESWLDHGHDYNMYWSPELVVKFLRLMRPMLDSQGMQDVGIACGETTNWLRFYDWGYADAIADDADAVNSLGLISSHGFVTYGDNRWFADTRSAGVDTVREKKPGLHAWTTSISWSKMDVNFLNAFRNNIYSAKVNAVIPWAGIQWSSKWVGGDPNPGTAIRVDGNGGYTVEAGYYFYKQLCRAGQSGMSVAGVSSNDTELGFMAFANNGTGNPDAFIILNTSQVDKKVDISITGANSETFEGYRTSTEERYAFLGSFKVREGVLAYTAPAGSATTFYAK
ncbi:MAG: hypothetical protein K0R09_2624 [Clostridiales bacterium]|jgi:hypothetical protein|nr:hypothetical protein [Clostridiales bacterium]